MSDSKPQEPKNVETSDSNQKHFQLTKPTKEKQQVAVLEPDHPLLEKFQRALKEHLEKQLEVLSEEVFELETETKKKDAAREQLGVEAYDFQQMVAKQQHELDCCMSELENLSAAREQLEHELKEVSSKHKKHLGELLEAERKEIELRNEVESMNLLVQQMVQWETDIESELMVNQRISEKTKKDKLKLAERKREQDMLVYKLMTEVWRLESERDTMDMQLRVQGKEREKLAEIAMQCNIDMEAFESEYRCLLHSWNSVVVTIGYRDKHFCTIKKELDTLHEQITNVNCEIKQVKKLCNKEMEGNATLTMIKQRIKNDIKNATVQMENENSKKEALEKKMSEMQAIIDQMVKDIQNTTASNNNKKTTLEVMTKEFEKINAQKSVYEEEILKTLQDKLTNDQAAKYLSKLLCQVKEKNHNLEINLASNENLRSKLAMEMESQKLVNHDLVQLLNDLLREQDIMQAQVTACVEAVRKIKLTIDKRQSNVDVLTKKLEKVTNKSTGMEESPQETKIKTLEKVIEEMTQKNKELQHYWLREQGNIVSLSEQRQNQKHEINLFRKQVMILEQKNLKIGDEIDNQKRQEDKMNRNVNNLQNELLQLNDSLIKKKGSKFDLDKHNNAVQTEYINKLKDAEIECLRLEASITDLEDDKQTLSNKLIDLNREALAWEKKLQMALEMRQNINEERKEGGEVGNMKAEIHRMHVRYSQLKKAQDKLIHDLEHCVARRDVIFRLCMAREKKVNAGKDSRIVLKRKLTDIKNKIKQLENEITSVTRKIELAEVDEGKLQGQFSSLQKDIDSVTDDTEYICSETEKSKTEIQLKLELLSLKQKQLKVYTELSKGRKPFTMYRTQSALDAEYDKQRELNGKLCKIIEDLISDFPKQHEVLQRIFNSLKLYVFVMLG